MGFAAAVALALAVTGCGRSSAGLGEWSEMRTRQVGVRLEPGTTTVEIRDAADGWTERVEVESDGRTVVAGIPEAETRVTVGPLDRADDRPYFVKATDEVPLSGSTLDRATALCLWVGARAYADGAPRLARPGDEPVTGPDGRTVLERIETGGAFNCLSLATVFVDAARSRGLLARRVALAVRDNSPYEGHAVGEVWSPELGKWFVVDPTYGLTYTLNGRPADALELHDAVASGRTSAIRVVRDPGAEALDPWEAEINPLHYFRNVYRLLDDEGPWLRYAGPGAPPALVSRAGYVQTDSPALFALDPGLDEEVPERIGRVEGRIVYQAVGGVLYVCLADGLYAPGRFFARATRGASVAYTPEVAAYDPDDADLLAPEELAPNPTFADADRDDVPDGWAVESGSARFAWTGDGALVVEAGAEGCALASGLPAAEGLAIAATIRARVDRGAARFAVRDREPDDYATIAPGPLADTSPILMRPSAKRLGLRLALEPNTRCLLERVSVRRERLLDEFVPRPSA